MTDHPEDAERAALRLAAHLLPPRWREIVDVVAAPVPATPSETAPAPSDPAAERLEQIEHIVVVMLENRSFDHMLGYLSLPTEEGGHGRADIDGLTGPRENVNSFEGSAYPIHHLQQTQFAGEAASRSSSAARVARSRSSPRASPRRSTLGISSATPQRRRAMRSRITAR